MTLLAALRDKDGRVQVPGFYDDVVPLTDREREEFARCRSPTRSSWSSSASTACRAKRVTPSLERRWARPTCDINGLTSGYQGEGAKTVLPAAGQREVQLPARAESGPAEDRVRRCGSFWKSDCRRASRWS